MEENNYRALVSLSKEIVTYLDDLIKNHFDDVNENASDERSAWKFVVENLKEINEYYLDAENRDISRDIVGLAEVQVGLAKYFDYYSTQWMRREEEAELTKLIDRIVVASLRIIQPQFGIYSVCGQHEDGACIEGPLAHRFMPNGNLLHATWPILPGQDAVNFSARPHPITLSAGETLYRVIGTSNNPCGNWWFRKNINSYTKKTWRSGCAVLTSWNPDNYYVFFQLDQQLKVWKGPAASQRVPKTKCLLMGGEEQIWLEPSFIRTGLSPRLTPHGF